MKIGFTQCSQRRYDLRTKKINNHDAINILKSHKTLDIKITDVTAIVQSKAYCCSRHDIIQVTSSLSVQILS